MKEKSEKSRSESSKVLVSRKSGSQADYIKQREIYKKDYENFIKSKGESKKLINPRNH